MVVPVSFDNWSPALGMYVVRSTGSFEAIARRVNVAEFNANHLQEENFYVATSFLQFDA
ncbi:hypothetical protein Syun_005826 [Stephania yunnanensis]|uniref:Uncharacterized protein n=1 Tax=Stephania yunnanensis TaxID=152371 RepID=A0AAP0KWI2_9MAGN